MSEWMIVRYKARRASGLCTVCGIERTPRATCERCAEIAASRRRIGAPVSLNWNGCCQASGFHRSDCNSREIKS